MSAAWVRGNVVADGDAAGLGNDGLLSKAGHLAHVGQALVAFVEASGAVEHGRARGTVGRRRGWPCPSCRSDTARSWGRRRGSPRSPGATRVTPLAHVQDRTGPPRGPGLRGELDELVAVQ